MLFDRILPLNFGPFTRLSSEITPSCSNTVVISCDSGWISVKEIVKNFYCGNHSEVIRVLGKAPLLESKHLELWPYQIGSLVFTGSFLEATSLFNLALKQKNLGIEELTQARFFIGIGLTRVSKYNEAKEIFATNLRELRLSQKRHKDTWKQSFYAYQGAAFYRFFCGRFLASRKLAEKAFQSAFEGNFLFGQAFASELMGHCNCQLGEVHKGIKDLEKAIHAAEEIGNGGLTSAFKIALEKFKSQFGIELKNAEKRLTKALKTLKPEDTYSKAELCLELSRLLILKGACSKAKDLLDESSESIYQHQNRRQSSVFNLRYAHILHLQGESKAALMLLRSTLANLNPNVDHFYLRQLRGFEEKILQEIEPLNSKGNPKASRFTNYIDERSYARTHSHHKMTIRAGDDVIGDILDAVSRQKYELGELQKNGLWGLLPKILRMETASSFVLLGPTRGEISLYSKGDAHWVASGVTQPMIKILQLLEGGNTLSKEEIVKEVWNYEYRSDRHDSLLQATIGKLRKHLGPFSEWIQWGSGGYRLKHEVLVISYSIAPNSNSRNTNIKTPSIKSQTLEKATQEAALVLGSDLNHRQIKLLSQLKDGSFIGVNDYSKRFKVCKMTACRDLTSLFKKNILKKYGRARATQYAMKGLHNEPNLS